MNERRFSLGVTATVLWIAACCAMLFLKRGDLSAMPPNAWGDFLAGAFAPLAFLWLVLGYLQQGEELRMNTEALRLQAEELRNSVEQQRALVEVSRQQVEAEREALKTELCTRTAAAKPVMTIESNGGAFRGDGQSTYPLILANCGAMATRFEAILRHPLGRIQTLYKAPTFDRGFMYRAQTEVDRPEQIEGAVLELRFSDVLGNEFFLRYLINRDGHSAHSNLTIYPVEA